MSETPADKPTDSKSVLKSEGAQEPTTGQTERPELLSAEPTPNTEQTGLQLSARSKLITACLFDLDGTLVDTTADITTAVNEARAHFELPALSLEEVARGIGHGATALLEATFPSELMSERLTEVNVTSPTGIQELGRHTNSTPSDAVIAWAEAHRIKR